MATYGNGKFVEDKWELTDCTIGRGTWRHFDVNDGDYGFSVFLPKELYEALEEEGWYVKHKEQYAGRDCEYFIDVSFSFDNYPPQITLINADGDTVIVTRDNVALLQTADFEKVDLVIRPYNWKNMKGESGCAAKVDTMTIWLKKPRRSMSASLHSRDDDD